VPRAVTMGAVADGRGRGGGGEVGRGERSRWVAVGYLRARGRSEGTDCHSKAMENSLAAADFTNPIMFGL
jgi:hypothetical protein